MNCPYCNTPLSPESNFCPKCGRQLPNNAGWQQCAFPPPPAAAPAENRSTASLVLGICSLLTWLLPLIGFPVSIVGLILGIRKKYTAGIVLNVIGLVLTVANSAIGAYMGATGQI